MKKIAEADEEAEKMFGEKSEIDQWKEPKVEVKALLRNTRE